MFREALLESSPAMRKRSPWPMATAFTLQFIVASALVLLPLISTGILPLSSTHVAPPPTFVPIDPVRPITTTAATNHTVVVNLPSHEVVQLVNLNPRLANPFSTLPVSDAVDASATPPIGVVNGDATATKSLVEINTTPPKPPARLVISHSLEAMLVNKVIPEYPTVARVAGVQGDIKLHAIIAKDGTIQSLAVTSGPEMLREAAIKAVQQWRYRPYMLNGAAVEVETVITVSFKRS